MLASVYIKDGNICFFNEKNSLSSLGGFTYELGRPLLDFVCYEPERFADAFGMIAETYDNEFTHYAVKNDEFIAEQKKNATKFQTCELYVYFYFQMLTKFVYDFVDSPKTAMENLSKNLPGAEEKLAWAKDFEWPTSTLPFVEVAVFSDHEKCLFRAAKEVVALMFEDLKNAQEALKYDIELLLIIRESREYQGLSSLGYLCVLEKIHLEHSGGFFFLEKPFQTFYGMTKPGEIAELYEVDSIKDLLRFEFIKMIEHDIFIKKCKNCEHFFIPSRRTDANYCDRIFADTKRKCSEVGAMRQYEKKVAENPVWEVYKKAYRRLNSRVRNKKMTQSEFLKWSEEATQKRGECEAGELGFEEFVRWLDEGRVRRRK